MACYGDTFYTDNFLCDVMGIDSFPTSLYHYTTIETLGLIIANQNIRFNRMDKVNEAEEAIACDLLGSNTTQFVSCWTAESSESISLWHMYSNQFNGVRIQMPVNMFLGRPNPTVFDRGGSMIFLNEYYSIQRIRGLFSVNSNIMFGPNPVFYTDDIQYHHPAMLTDTGDPYREGIPHVRISPIDLGCAKGTEWAFEKEWRFKLSLFGIGEEFPKDTIGKIKLDLINNPVTTEYIDIKLSKN